MNLCAFVVSFIALFLTLSSSVTAFLPPLYFTNPSQNSKYLTPSSTSGIINNKSFANANVQHYPLGKPGQINTSRNGSIRRVIY